MSKYKCNICNTIMERDGLKVKITHDLDKGPWSGRYPHSSTNDCPIQPIASDTVLRGDSRILVLE